MRKFLLSLAIIAFTVSAAFAQTVTKNYKFGNITSIDASYVFNVNVTKGSSEKVEVICPDYLQSYLDISSFNGILLLKMQLPKNFKHPRNSSQEIIVNMQMRTIKSIDLSGASSFSATGEYTTDNLTYSLSGASKVSSININGKHVKLDCSGASTLNHTGNFDIMEVDCSGASKMGITGNIGNIQGDISGATNFNYDGNSSKISMELSGASKARLKGKTNILNISCSGASFMNAKEMIATDATVGASGASKINIHVTNMLKADATASSIINYSGNPRELISKPTNIRKAD